MKTLATLLTTLAITVSLNAHSATSTSTTTTVTSMYTYAGLSDLENDIIVKVTTPVTGCEGGFWVKSTDNLANQNISSFLLSAFHNGSKVYFGAYIDQTWSASASPKYCRVHSIGVEK